MTQGSGLRRSRSAAQILAHFREDIAAGCEGGGVGGEDDNDRLHHKSATSEYREYALLTFISTASHAYTHHMHIHIRSTHTHARSNIHMHGGESPFPPNANTNTAAATGASGVVFGLFVIAIGTRIR